MTARPALQDLLPPHVACWETAGDAPDGSLHPEEAAGIRTARPLRRAEFVTGRHCAHRAMERLGAPAAPVPRGVRGAPGWPAGIVGSITHCAGYRAAAVARSGRVRAVGIDAEPDLP
ncbi:4'-phosphopantetheinyl transferase, partial [Streptomyces sp. Ru73]|uniref:4'-phosphopantetheinyl transferase family protein n=1 Tax=Streptomyces sp. Ru73 TaxID=2080748 RepID=UPI000D42CF99